MSLDRQQTNRECGVEDSEKEPLSQLSQLQSSSTSASEVITFHKPFFGFKQVSKIWQCSFFAVSSQFIPKRHLPSKMSEVKLVNLLSLRL